SLRLERARETRDEAETARSLRHLLALERAVTSEITILARLVGLAVRAQRLKAGAAMIHGGEMSATLAAQLGQVMDDHEPLPLALTVETERRIALDTVANTGKGVESAVAAAGGDGGLTRKSQAKAISMIDAYMDGLRDYATGDPA